MSKGRISRKEAPGASRAAARCQPPVGPELPVGKAFVLQLSRETGPALAPLAGRVEHLSTGRRVRFGSVEELMAALTRLLRETKQ